MKLKLLLLAIGLAGIGAAAYLGLHHDAGSLFVYKTQPALVAEPPAALAVSVAKVREMDFVETVLVTGTLVPREEILVAPEIDGLRIVSMEAEEGDRVVKGQVLARLERENLAAQMAQNDASLARADAAIAQAGSQIAQAQARVDEAKNAFDRAKPLTKSGYLSESAYDQREAAAKTAEAQLVATRDGLKVAEAEKKQVEAQRRELSWRLGNTEVRAPEDGIISRRTARIGGMASAVAEPLFRIIARGEIELDAEVTETRLARVALGQTAHVEVAGTKGVEGKVRLVSPEVDKATRLGRVRISLGTSPDLRIGAFGRGVIDTTASRGLAVPAAAVLFDDQGGASVQLVKNGKVETRPITPGLSAMGMVEVRSGLTEGDVVIAKSGTFLRDGDAVRAVEPDAKVSEAGR